MNEAADRLFRGGPVSCVECGEPVDVLTKAHLRRHGLSKQDYLRRHPQHAPRAYWGSIESRHVRGQPRRIRPLG